MQTLKPGNMTFDQVLNCLNDQIVDHEYAGEPGGHELLLLQRNEYRLILFFYKNFLMGGNEFDGQMSTFIKPKNLLPKLDDLLHPCAG